MTEQGKAPAARTLDHAQEIIASLYANGAAMAETIDGLRVQKKALADALEKARECHDDHCDRAACAIGPDIRHALILAGRLPSAEEGSKPQRPPAPSTTSSVAPAVPTTGRSSGTANASADEWAERCANTRIELINAEARIRGLTDRLRKMDGELVETRGALRAAKRTVCSLLDGDRWHRCPEWDEMWINDLMPEFEHCLCFKAASESEPAEGRPSPEIPAIPGSKG